ncbi:hypothetical protein [Halpernia frigidisoli]|nr:hypothetical protein [Halpernia frigidisoli]
MKKILLLITASFILMNCGSGDNRDEITSPISKKLLLSKITTVYYDSPGIPQTTVDIISYDDKGEILKSVSDDGNSSVFEYINGKPSRALYYNPNNTLEYTSNYKYNGDILVGVKSFYSDPTSNRDVSYTYNGAGKLISAKLCQSTNCNNPYTTTLQYNGENVSVEILESGSSFGLSTKREFTYDDKFSPYTNFNPYIRTSIESAFSISKNNYLTEKISVKNSSGVYVANQSNTYSVVYNAENFPTEVIGKDKNGNTEIQYKYEYILK